MNNKRVDLKAILSDPVKRRKLMVGALIATQAREGIVTTQAQAETAYDNVRARVAAGDYPWCARDYAAVQSLIDEANAR